MTASAGEIISMLDMRPHPEGGHFVETFRDPSSINGRSASTAIYYLLAAGEKSDWHRIDAAEIWHYYAGDPLELLVASGGRVEAKTLGPAIERGERPQIVVLAGAWQAASPLGRWTLVGCTVAPGFTFDSFELAPAGFDPAA